MPLQKAGKRSQKSEVRSLNPLLYPPPLVKGEVGGSYGFSILSSGFCLLSSFLLIFFSYIPLLADKGEQALIKVAQGEAFIFKLAPGKDTAAIKGSLLGREIPFFKLEEELYGALVGIDILDEAKRHELQVEIIKKDGSVINRSYYIDIIAGVFAMEELTLPKEMVELDEAVLRRVKAEEKRITEVFSGVTGERLWKGNFIIPVEGRLIENFGNRRILNGLPRTPHNGVDISAPAGTEVHASNEGIVVVMDDLFFNGKSVFIDHGLGVYTVYSHLSQINVSSGDRIRKGGLIGLVGSSGRATGPHLHWGMKINGARVNPLSATRISRE